MLGLGDASFNTQCYSILSHMYQEESSSAFALFKFSQSIAAAAAFFYRCARVMGLGVLTCDLSFCRVRLL